MTAIGTWQLMAETESRAGAPWLGDMEMDLWLYRDRTVAILKRYARSSVEVGRLPSLLGREFFRTRVTSYRLASFEDIVIFVHDVERALGCLDKFQGRLVAMNVLEEYSMPEVARLVGCPLRTVERVVPEALDKMSRVFLEGGLINELVTGTRGEKTCQEGKNHNIGASDCKSSKNIGNNILDKSSDSPYIYCMERKSNQPKTLQDAVVYFSNPDNALAYMTILRWPDGIVVCPTCGRNDVVFLHNQRKWQCKSVHPKRQFSAKVGTLLEDSPIAIEKWLIAVWMLSNCRNGVSSYELARAIGITQKSAWFMLQRIRLGLQGKDGGKLGGDPHSKVEVDETFIGGKARNMHKSRRQRMTTVGKYTAKTAVMGMLERGGKVRTKVVGQRVGKQMQEIVRENVAPGTWVMTDEFPGYYGLKNDYTHLVVNHLDRYVQGNVHTQGIENFWSLLKRGLSGTYVAVEPFHLFRYVDEQAFRFNNRKDGDRKIPDSERFDIAMSQVIGKRLTFATLTGKDGSPTPF